MLDNFIAKELKILSDSISSRHGYRMMSKTETLKFLFSILCSGYG